MIVCDVNIHLYYETKSVCHICVCLRFGFVC